MKKLILIPDSFKGTMSSGEVCSIMKSVVLKYYPECNVISIPVADGGEGSVDAFIEALGGEKKFKEVTGPFFGEKVNGYYGVLPDGTAVVETAAAAALPMVEDRKNPLKTTTYGVGELMVEAARNGAKKIILGLGGSATNDGGSGIAAAMGVTFYNKKGESFVPTGGNIDEVDKIDTSTINECFKGVEIVTMCDIDNPFYGKEGASYVYGPQKGADEKMVELLDGKMIKLAGKIKEATGVDVQAIPGSGAAGGMGGAMAAYFKSELQMGIETVLEVTGFDSLASDADMIFTGEGKIDGQSLRGKVVIGVARKAKKLGVPVIALVGDIADGIEAAYDEGVTGIFSINRVAVPYKEARLMAQSDLSLTMDNLLRFMKSMKL